MNKWDNTTDDAPRCPTCGYVLVGLPEYRCPECGTPFASEYIEDPTWRNRLLPWERPEAGRPVRRFIRSLVQASLHPGRLFTNLNQRKQTRIRHPVKLIAACLLTALCFHGVALVVGRVAFFLRSVLKGGQPSRAFYSVLRSLAITWPTEIQLAITQVLSVMLPGIVLAALIRWRFRKELGSLRTLELAAIYSHAVAFGAFIYGVAEVVIAVFGGIFFVMIGAISAQAVVLLVLLWFMSRRLLSLSRWKAVFMLVTGGAMECMCYLVISSIVL